jgi:hypothetical protein
VGRLTHLTTPCLSCLTRASLAQLLDSCSLFCLYM